jgi:protein-S-isoprenylcysteine O-methyltransferase Ste14
VHAAELLLAVDVVVPHTDADGLASGALALRARAHGHDRATGGSLTPEEFELLLVRSSRLTPEVRKARATAGSLVFLALVPGVVAGVIPWLLTGWRVEEPLPHWLPLRVAGLVLVTAGVIVLVEAFVRFVAEGSGTPAPISPTERLVVGGFYRYVRNPMYLAVGATIVGQALLLGQPVLLLYAAGYSVAVAAFVRWYEEPTLRGRFGEGYERYRRAVPRWRPRRRPWVDPGVDDA